MKKSKTLPILTISKIEKLTETEVLGKALEIFNIKGFTCIFVEFEGVFGYSMLVFKNNHHIYYANEYELHHPYKSKKQLKEMYVDNLRQKLYTDEELMDECKAYKEYQLKSRFVTNYWIQQYDHISMFEINEHPTEFKARMKYQNSYCYCWNDNEEIVRIAKKYSYHLKQEFEKLKSQQTTFREMISYELSNHECVHTCDWQECLSALGLGFNELQGWQKTILRGEFDKQLNSYWDD